MIRPKALGQYRKCLILMKATRSLYFSGKRNHILLCAEVFTAEIGIAVCKRQLMHLRRITCGYTSPSDCGAFGLKEYFAEIFHEVVCTINTT